LRSYHFEDMLGMLWDSRCADERESTDGMNTSYPVLYPIDPGDGCHVTTTFPSHIMEPPLKCVH
jgi:hypothetical protein